MENVSTGVLDTNKEHYLRSNDKSEKSGDKLKHMQLHMSKYKKWRFTIQYVTPTALLFFKSQFPKQVVKHTGGKWLTHDTKRRKDNQLQSLKPMAPRWIWYSLKENPRAKTSWWWEIAEHQMPSDKMLFKTNTKMFMSMVNTDFCFMKLYLFGLANYHFPGFFSSWTLF